MSQPEPNAPNPVPARSRFHTLTSSWMLLSIATVLLWGSWGLESKIVVDRISPWMNQVLFSIGLLPLLAWMLFWKNLRQTTGQPNKGAAFGLLTGILGCLGNVTFYQVRRKSLQRPWRTDHTLDRMSQSLCDVSKRCRIAANFIRLLACHDRPRGWAEIMTCRIRSKRS